MEKQSFFHLHQMLGVTANRIAESIDDSYSGGRQSTSIDLIDQVFREMELEDYRSLDVRPSKPHKSKEDHKEAVFELVETIADTLNNQSDIDIQGLDSDFEDCLYGSSRIQDNQDDEWNQVSDELDEEDLTLDRLKDDLSEREMTMLDDVSYDDSHGTMTVEMGDYSFKLTGQDDEIHSEALILAEELGVIEDVDLEYNRRYYAERNLEENGNFTIHNGEIEEAEQIPEEAIEELKEEISESDRAEDIQRTYRADVISLSPDERAIVSYENGYGTVEDSEDSLIPGAEIKVREGKGPDHELSMVE